MSLPEHLTSELGKPNPEGRVLVQDPCLGETWGYKFHALALLPADNNLYKDIDCAIWARHEKLPGSGASSMLSACGLRNLTFERGLERRRFAQAEICYRGSRNGHLDFFWSNGTNCTDIAAALFLPNRVLDLLDNCRQVYLLREEPDDGDRLAVLSLTQNAYYEDNKIQVSRAADIFQNFQTERFAFFLGAERF